MDEEQKRTPPLFSTSLLIPISEPEDKCWTSQELKCGTAPRGTTFLKGHASRSRLWPCEGLFRLSLFIFTRQLAKMDA